ncbi:caspase family protein [Empedobacter brevis]
MNVIAVTVGNNDYCESNSKLDNAINDAYSMNQAFLRLGYQCIHRQNVDLDTFLDLLDELDSLIEKSIGSCSVIFYYAGHGLEFEGENFLVPVDCQLNGVSKHTVKRNCILLSEILEIMKKNSEKANILIIDACRKNLERGNSLGFAPIHSPKGTLIAFSTSPNEGALDSGYGNNSIYTGALLKYIGRERLSVEELFKKVRKTVYHLSGGRQTTWEHTSLIGDFIFNAGQMVYSLDIPYDEKVVKDSIFISNDEFGNDIVKLKSYDWYIQNDVLYKYKLSNKILNKNQLFILGRNYLQCLEGGSFEAEEFFYYLENNLINFFETNFIHFLNGVLFEMYFDSKSELRINTFKNNKFDLVFNVINDTRFKDSFIFIKDLLENYRDDLFFIPFDNEIIDVDVFSINIGNYEIIESIKINSKELLNDFLFNEISGNINNLKEIISKKYFIPKQYLNINSNIKLTNISIKPNEINSSWGISYYK